MPDSLDRASVFWLDSDSLLQELTYCMVAAWAISMPPIRDMTRQDIKVNSLVLTSLVKQVSDPASGLIQDQHCTQVQNLGGHL